VAQPHLDGLITKIELVHKHDYVIGGQPWQPWQLKKL